MKISASVRMLLSSKIPPEQTYIVRISHFILERNKRLCFNIYVKLTDLLLGSLIVTNVVAKNILKFKFL